MGPAITSAIATSSAEFTDIFTDNLGTIFLIFAGLVALGVLVRLWKKNVGRKA